MRLSADRRDGVVLREGGEREDREGCQEERRVEGTRRLSGLASGVGGWRGSTVRDVENRREDERTERRTVVCTYTLDADQDRNLAACREKVSRC